MCTKANSNSNRSSGWSFRFYVDDDGWRTRLTGKAEAVSHQHIGRVGLVCKLVLCDTLPSLDGSDSKIRIPQDSATRRQRSRRCWNRAIRFTLKKRFQPSPPGDSSLRFLLPVFPPTPSYQFVALFILAATNFQPASGFPLCCHFSAAPLCLPRASLLDQYRLIAVEYQDS